MLKYVLLSPAPNVWTQKFKSDINLSPLRRKREFNTRKIYLSDLVLKILAFRLRKEKKDQNFERKLLQPKKKPKKNQIGSNIGMGIPMTYTIHAHISYILEANSKRPIREKKNRISKRSKLCWRNWMGFSNKNIS